MAPGFTGILADPKVFTLHVCAMCILAGSACTHMQQAPFQKNWPLHRFPNACSIFPGAVPIAYQEEQLQPIANIGENGLRSIPLEVCLPHV